MISFKPRFRIFLCATFILFLSGFLVDVQGYEFSDSLPAESITTAVSRHSGPKPFAMPDEVTQAVIVIVVAVVVAGLLGYVYQTLKAQADSKPSWTSKRKEPKRKWSEV